MPSSAPTPVRLSSPTLTLAPGLSSYSTLSTRISSISPLSSFSSSSSSETSRAPAHRGAKPSSSFVRRGYSYCYCTLFASRPRPARQAAPYFCSDCPRTRHAPGCRTSPANILQPRPALHVRVVMVPTRCHSSTPRPPNVLTLPPATWRISTDLPTPSWPAVYFGRRPCPITQRQVRNISDANATTVYEPHMHPRFLPLDTRAVLASLRVSLSPCAAAVDHALFLSLLFLCIPGMTSRRPSTSPAFSLPLSTPPGGVHFHLPSRRTHTRHMRRPRRRATAASAARRLRPKSSASASSRPTYVRIRSKLKVVFTNSGTTSTATRCTNPVQPSYRSGRRPDTVSTSAACPLGLSPPPPVLPHRCGDLFSRICAISPHIAQHDIVVRFYSQRSRYAGKSCGR
ncbi:hypothetical protein C8Q77DRAFT_497204 [Trametes polyzona]|nr:hypothetical protein C8Q77DRAFT_497204 [Trametes polyzona]